LPTEKLADISEVKAVRGPGGRFVSKKAVKENDENEEKDEDKSSFLKKLIS
jgi:hypothetical protein